MSLRPPSRSGAFPSRRKPSHSHNPHHPWGKTQDGPETLDGLPPGVVGWPLPGAPHSPGEPFWYSVCLHGRALLGRWRERDGEGEGAEQVQEEQRPPAPACCPLHLQDGSGPLTGAHAHRATRATPAAAAGPAMLRCGHSLGAPGFPSGRGSSRPWRDTGKPASSLPPRRSSASPSETPESAPSQNAAI